MLPAQAIERRTKEHAQVVQFERLCSRLERDAPSLWCFHGSDLAMVKTAVKALRLTQALASNTRLVKLEVDPSVLRLETASQLGEAFANCKSPTRVKYTSSSAVTDMAAFATRSFCRAFSSSASVERVAASGWNGLSLGDLNTWPVGMRELSLTWFSELDRVAVTDSLASATSLQRLSLEYCSDPDLLYAVRDGLKGRNCFLDFELDPEVVSPEAWHSFVHSTRLLGHVNFQLCCCHDQDVGPFLEPLESAPYVKTITIALNNPDQRAANSIQRLFTNAQHLEDVTVRAMHDESDEVEFNSGFLPLIAAPLYQHTCLTQITLSFRDLITRQGLVVFGELLRRDKLLKSLTIDGLERPESRVVTTFADLPVHHNLEDLSISWSMDDVDVLLPLLSPCLPALRGLGIEVKHEPISREALWSLAAFTAHDGFEWLRLEGEFGIDQAGLRGLIQNLSQRSEALKQLIMACPLDTRTIEEIISADCVNELDLCGPLPVVESLQHVRRLVHLDVREWDSADHAQIMDLMGKNTSLLGLGLERVPVESYWLRDLEFYRFRKRILPFLRHELESKSIWMHGLGWLSRKKKESTLYYVLRRHLGSLLGWNKDSMKRDRSETARYDNQSKA